MCSISHTHYALMATTFNAINWLVCLVCPRDPNSGLWGIQVVWCIWGFVMIPTFIMFYVLEERRPAKQMAVSVNLILYFITFILFLWYTPTSVFGGVMVAITVEGFVLVGTIPDEEDVRVNQVGEVPMLEVVVVERQLDPEVIVPERQMDPEVVVEERQLDPEVVVERQLDPEVIVVERQPSCDLPPSPSYTSHLPTFRLDDGVEGRMTPDFDSGSMTINYIPPSSSPAEEIPPSRPPSHETSPCWEIV